MTVELQPVATKRISDYYKPFPKQEVFHRSPAKYRLFGGAAGPGKTKALLWEAIFQANEVPGCSTLLLRRTYPELEGSLLRQFRTDVPRELYWKFNESKHLVTWHNGSTTRFGYCKNEKDVYQYQGDEYLFIGFDELTFFTLKQWQFLTSRNRCPVRGSFPNMAGASNPGNIGHAWVKAMWHDHVAPAGMEEPDKYNPAEYDFVRAKIEDNPIYAHDASYRATLDALPRRLRQAFLDGDWSIFAGQYFDIFDVGRHVETLEGIGIQDWWPVWVSVDWGFHHPSAVYWHTRGDDGRCFTYREFVKDGLSPRMLAQASVERSKRRHVDADGVEAELQEPVKVVYLSPDAYASRTSESSIAEQLGDVLSANGMPRPTPADDDRIGGWQLWYSLMEQDQWACTTHCRKLQECIQTLIRDEDRPEDIAKIDGDDPGDSVRYGLYSMLRKREKPLALQLKDATKDIIDPTARAIFTQRMIAEQQKRIQRDGMPEYTGGGRLRWQKH